MGKIIFVCIVVIICGCTNQRNNRYSTIDDFESFRNIDIFTHAAPYNFYQKVNVPTDVNVDVIYIKIYPIIECPPTLMASFFIELTNDANNLPFYETIVNTPKRIGQFSYEWSIDASVIDISKIPRRGGMWIGFHEQGKYGGNGPFSYNCQVIRNGNLHSYDDTGNWVDGLIIKGKSQYAFFSGYCDDIIPYGFGKSIINR